MKDPHPFYEIPKGEIGNCFLNTQTALWKGVYERHWNLEKPLIFAACMLTKESGAKFAPDIRKLIMIRLDTWEQGKICSLVLAVEAGAKGGPGKRPNAVGDEELFEWANTVDKKLDSMILSGKLRNTVRMVTNCGKDGLLKPTNECSRTKLPVIDVLRAKHPDIRVPDLIDGDQAQSFSEYMWIDEHIPIMCHEDYVSRIAPKLSGTAGLSGLDGEHLKGWLLWHMLHADALCEEMGKWVQWLSNGSPLYAA